MNRRWYAKIVVAFVAAMLVAGPFSMFVAADDAQVQSISTYWHPRVQQWGEYIVQEANSRQIDPDLIASLLWQESRGDNTAIGPVGAVGLLQIMPKEAGFTWRPTREELINPATNLFWGTRTLATIIKQGKGDIFNALAAYNGGWEQTMYRGPTIFATTILRDYAKAVHLRYELSDTWIAYFAVQSPEFAGPIWIADSRRDDVYHFGDSNDLPGGVTLIPDLESTSIVAIVDDVEEDVHFQVGLWLYDIKTGRWVSRDGTLVKPTAEPPGVREPQLPAGASIFLDSESVEPEQEVDVEPPEALMEQPVEPTVEVSDEPVPTPTPEAPSQPAAEAKVLYGITATKAVIRRDLQADNNQDNVHSSAPVLAAVVEEDSPVTPASACQGGELHLIAYPLERENTVDGWRARIYAEGIGGNCSYSFAWNTEDDVRVTQVTTSVTFYVSTPDRGRAIMGTVIVISGDAVVRVPLYIESPD